MPFDHLLAQRTGSMGASAIREILKVVNQPGMVSLAGGLPAAESFPMGILRELADIVDQKYGPRAYQYDATEGFEPLRQALVPFLAKKGVIATSDEILITSGSQGILDGIGKVLIDPGDVVAVEAPTYLGALQAFNPYQPRYVQIATDEGGLLPDSMEAVLRDNAVKVVYLVPTFQNPTGRTLSTERRKAVAALAIKYNALIIEDDPYSDLRYRGEPVPTIHSFAPENVVYAGTLSKILAPGLRLGFVVAPALVRQWLVIAKQGVDLHTSTYTQALAAEYLDGGYLERHLPSIIALYRPRQEALLAAIEAHLPPGFTWTRPDGGMFTWVEGPAGLDAEAIYWRAVERNIAFVPGTYFYANEGDGKATMRLNFTTSDEATLDRAVSVLADVIREMS